MGNEAKKFLYSLSIKKRKFLLSKIRDTVLQHIKRKNPEFDMKKRIENAVKDKILSEVYARYLLFTLNALKKDSDFQKDWAIIQKRWKEIYYGSKEEGLYFSSDLVDEVGYEVFRILWKSMKDKSEALKISRLFKNDIKDFLERWRIDAVIDGNPLVDINYFKKEFSLDYVGRPIIRLEIPLMIPVLEFRKIIEKEYTKAKKDYYKSTDFLKYPRARWGEKSGKREYYLKRDEKIIEEFLKLRKQGLTIEKALEVIYFKMGLERDMEDVMSLKPIIRRVKQRVINK